MRKKYYYNIYIHPIPPSSAIAMLKAGKCAVLGFIGGAGVFRSLNVCNSS